MTSLLTCGKASFYGHLLKKARTSISRMWRIIAHLLTQTSALTCHVTWVFNGPSMGHRQSSGRVRSTVELCPFSRPGSSRRETRHVPDLDFVCRETDCVPDLDFVCRETDCFSDQGFVCRETGGVPDQGFVCRETGVFQTRASLPGDWRNIDPNTKKFRRTLIYYDTDTHYENTLAVVQFQIIIFLQRNIA